MENENFLKITDLEVGQGTTAEKGALLTLHYEGRLSSGEKFDSSFDRQRPFQFVIGSGRVIKGWDQGLLGMRVGGKRRLEIQPEWAYGSRQIGPIPPNSVLIFEVELLEAMLRE
jgi:peptidylprolyl isomerase